MNWTNNKVYKAILKNGILFFVLFFCIAPVEAKLAHEKTKTISKEFEVNDKTYLDLKHNRGWINVLYHDGPLAKIESNLVVQGNEEADLEKLIAKYRIEVKEEGAKIKVHSGFQIKEWSSTTWFFGWGSHKIKFLDGDQISTKVDIVKADLTLWLPNIAKLKLENEYSNIQVGDLACAVEVDLFSGNLDVGNLEGDLKVKLKYGNANIGNLQHANIDIFEGLLFLKNGESITLKSKYSKIEAGQLHTMELDIFEGKISVEEIKNTLEIKGKYAEINIKKMDRGDWDLFECKVNLDQARELQLNGKYGEHKIRSIDKLVVEVFESNFAIHSVGSILSNSDKYSEFKIDLLRSSFSANQSFEGKLHVSTLMDSFEGIDFTGKYGRLKLPLYQIDHYQLDVATSYGQVDYEESKMEISRLINDGDDFALVGKSLGGAGSALVKVRGFEMSLSVLE